MNEKNGEFTHFDLEGNAHMVDVSEKDITRRTALASGSIRLSGPAMDAVLGKKIKKGDVMTVAQVAGIMGAKSTSSLIPMCHNINLESCKLYFTADTDKNTITAFCEAGTASRTGVEMEALTGVSIALLTIYDMCKAIDRAMVIEDIRLVKKTK